MQKTISKAKIIKALETEPLAQGDYIQLDWEDNACYVCAVGAILRNAKCADTEIGRTASSMCYKNITNDYWDGSDRLTIKKFLNKGDYLTALSEYFEHFETGPDGEVSAAHRKKLVRFVEKYFPEKISLSVPK